MEKTINEENKEIINEENKEVIDSIVPEGKTMREYIIDSMVSSRNFFVNNLAKKLTDSDETIQMKMKIKIKDEYNDVIEDKNIKPNKYGEGFSFRKSIPQVNQLAENIDGN
jgi:hypothetical protein